MCGVRNSRICCTEWDHAFQEISELSSDRQIGHAQETRRGHGSNLFDFQGITFCRLGICQDLLQRFANRLPCIKSEDGHIGFVLRIGRGPAHFVDFSIETECTKIPDQSPAGHIGITPDHQASGQGSAVLYQDGPRSNSIWHLHSLSVPALRPRATAWEGI